MPKSNDVLDTVTNEPFYLAVGVEKDFQNEVKYSDSIDNIICTGETPEECKQQVLEQWNSLNKTDAETDTLQGVILKVESVESISYDLKEKTAEPA